MKANDEEYAKIGRAVWAYYRARCVTQVSNAIRNGLLPKPYLRPCVDCGESADEYEHRNYARPVDVVAVCHACNLRRGPAELDPEVVIHHLRWNDDMPYENARLMRLKQSRFRRECVCCEDGENFVSMHDADVHEKPVYRIGDMWDARLTITRLSDSIADMDKDPREVLALYLAGVESMKANPNAHDAADDYCQCITCQYERARDTAEEGLG